MDLSYLSDAELTVKVDTLSVSERKSTLDVLYHLIELDKRRLYARLGYSSLFDFCVRKLRYSSSAAVRRVAAARCLRDNPEIASLLVQGKVTLCSVCAAAEYIKRDKISCDAIVDRSAREVKVLVAPFTPKERVPAEIVRPLSVKDDVTSEPSAQTVEERYEIRFSVTKDVYEQFEEAKNRLSNSIGKHLTVEAVIEKLLTHFLRDKATRQASPASGRRVPRAVKREVYKRDSGCCTFRSSDGTRCTERRYLHFDHIVPVALGGKSEASNIRLLCSAHNQYEARRILESSGPPAGASKVLSFAQTRAASLRPSTVGNRLQKRRHANAKRRSPQSK